MTTEQQRLDTAVDAFCVAMKARLASKRKQGWKGWDGSKPSWWTGDLAQRLVNNAIAAKEGTHREKSLIDVANLAMMLWHREK